LLTLKVFGIFGYIKGTWKQKHIFLLSGVYLDDKLILVFVCFEYYEGKLFAYL